MTPSRFALQMAWLRDGGWRVLRLEEGWRRLAARDDLTGCVAVTFDDGYAAFLDYAAPILARHDFPATLFVVAGKLGVRADWQGVPSNCRLLSLDELRALRVEGHSVGSHSLTHPRLPRLGDAVLDVEVAESRRYLAEVLGVAPQVFAYPYGDLGPREQAVVARGGYSWACGIRGWSNTYKTNPLALHRTEVWAGYSLTEYAALFTARVKWPRVTRAARHILGMVSHDTLNHHSQPALPGH